MIKNPIFYLSFSLVTLLNLGYAILRAARNAITVAGVGKSELIPYFELLGTLPASILFTMLVTRLSMRFNPAQVFALIISLFLAFFLFFSLFLNSAFLFFVMAELWKVIPLTVLVWGLLNQYVTKEESLQFYPPLMLGGSLGTLLAGPIITTLTSHKMNWQASLLFLILVLSVLGIIAILIFYRLHKILSIRGLHKKERAKERINIFRHPLLSLIFLIVMIDYVAYSLGEIVFLDLLKEKFPGAKEYCHFMGILSFWTGLMTALSALFFTPFILKRASWLIVALVTPIFVLATETTFFAVLRLPHSFLDLAIFLGSLQYTLCRAAKYTFFDTAKEVVLVQLTIQEKWIGKCAIDGIGARAGKGLASLTTISLASLMGGIRASAWLAGFFSIGMTLTWLFATVRLGTRYKENFEGS